MKQNCIFSYYSKSFCWYDAQETSLIKNSSAA